MKHRLVLVDALRVQALPAMRRRAWGKAEAALHESLELARTLPYPYAEAKALHAYGAFDVARGESALAREKYEQALAVSDRLGEIRYRSHSAQALAEL
jgi:hypothetical protein